MLIADFHNDILTSEGFSSLNERYNDNDIVTALFKGKRSFTEVLSLAKRGRLIAFEDVGYLDFDYEKAIELNPVYVGITWNGENQFGYGCDYSFGLKNKGVELIRRLNKDGVAVDTAHISKKGFCDVIDLADTVINSHTCFNGIFKHKRNLDDWQIKLLLERGGLIGLTCCGYFMTNVKHCKINDYIDNIMYFYDRYGMDNLCIGTDFYGTDFLPDGLNTYEGFLSVFDELLKRGVKKDDIDKFTYGNLNSFLKLRRK